MPDRNCRLTTYLACRIHITGASGCGTTTLATLLAQTLGIRAFDTDDFYWLPTDPPYREARPVADRLRLMEETFLAGDGWVLSGSLHSWGAPVMTRVTDVVFLTLPPSQRLARLRERERRRFGARIGPGGDMEKEHRAFLGWAMAYDEPGTGGRSRAAHEAWLADLPQPVLRLLANVSPEALVSAICDHLDARKHGR